MDKTQAKEGDRTEDDPEPPIDDSHLSRSSDDLPNDESNRPGAGDSDLVDVVVNGQPIKMTPEAADAIQAERDEWSRQLDEASATPDADPVTLDAGQDTDDLANLLYSDPKAFIDRVRDDVRQELSQDYSRDQARRDFWSDFYAENEDLRDERRLVELTLNDHLDELHNLKGRSGRDQLAKLTKKEILRIANKHGKTPRKDDTTTLEGSNNLEEGDQPSEPTRQQNRRTASIGDALKERRLNRARAARQTVN